MSTRRHCRRALSVLLVSVLPLGAMASSSSGAAAVDETPLGQGVFSYYQAGTLSKPSGRTSAIALAVDTHVQMTISGWVNRVAVKQVFVNDSDDWLNGQYQFPLPHNAAVDSLKLHIGQRVIEGEIQPKAVAKQLFEKAKDSGKKASLVSQQRPNLFTSEVANLGPGEALVVEIAYQQQVQYRDGEFSLRFPTAVTPRYFPHDVMVERKAVTQEPHRQSETLSLPGSRTVIGTPEVPAGQKLYMDIRLDAGMAIRRLETPYHDMEQTQLGGTTIGLSLKASRRPDRDFVLKWRPLLGDEPTAMVFAQQGKTHAAARALQRQDHELDDYALVMLMPPQDKTRVDLPRELILVIDTSGSMSGDSIVQAKSAILHALAGLGSDDIFNLIAFDSSVRSLSPTPLAATAANIGRANLFVRSLEADGGTEMAPALMRALANQQDENYLKADRRLKQVVFITDGAIGNEASLFALIAAHIGERRLFTVGIGAAPNGYFMERAAKAGRGSYTYVGKISEVDARIGRLFEKIESPQISNVTLTLDDGSIPDYWPVQIGDLYAGEPIMVALKLSAEQRLCNDALVISGDLDGQSWQRRLALPMQATPKGIDLIWANNQINALQLTKNQHNHEEVKASVTELAMDYHLVSTYTSLIAVDKTPSRPMGVDGVEVIKPAPQPIAAQWPQTATESRLYLAIGGMLVLLFGAYSLSYLPCLNTLWRHREHREVS